MTSKPPSLTQLLPVVMDGPVRTAKLCWFHAKHSCICIIGVRAEEEDSKQAENQNVLDVQYESVEQLLILCSERNVANADAAKKGRGRGASSALPVS